MKRLLSIVLVLVLVFVLFACGEGEQGATEPVNTTTKASTTLTTTAPTTTTQFVAPVTEVYGDFVYLVEGDGVVITEYTGSDESVEIPQTIGGRQVVEIGFSAFRDCGVKSVVVPFGVREISAYAFFGTPLESVEIPDTVTFIGNNAFSYTNLTELEAPLGISTITAEAFSFCERLQSVILGGNITQIENGAFAFCPSLEAVYIPYSIDYIADDAFEGSTYLVLFGEEDSYAEQFAEDMEISFEIV